MALTEAEAALVKGMLLRGDRQQDIAAWFSCNSGRVAEINKGMRYPKVKAAPAVLLPPPGPYHLAALANGEATSPLAQNRQAADAAVEVLADFEARLLGELKTATTERRQTNALVELLLRQQQELRRLMGSLEKPQTPRIGRRRPLGHD